MVLMCLCKNQKMREIPLLVLNSNSGLNKLTFQGQEACTQAIGTAQWTMLNGCDGGTRFLIKLKIKLIWEVLWYTSSTGLLLHANEQHGRKLLTACTCTTTQLYSVLTRIEVKPL